ncbi:MAG: prepilin peptidase [Bacteroidia bacterium]
MPLFFLISICFISLIISFQDFKERLISVWVLIPFSFLILIESVILIPKWQVLYSAIINLGLLTIQFLLVFLYYFLRYRDSVKMRESIGGADIWVFLTLIVAFCPPNFLIFEVVSTSSALILFIVLRPFMLNRVKYFPLAGFVCLMYCISRIIMYFYSPLWQWNDMWVFELGG